MYRIAILGCENFHAKQFLRFIKDDEEFSSIDVLGVYSDEKEAAESLNKEYGVEIMPTSDSLVGEVDGIIVTARDGKRHLDLIKPYAKYGIPVFIDKPITESIADAKELSRLLAENNNQFVGGSVMKHTEGTKRLAEMAKNSRVLGGEVCAPIMMNSPYGGYFFYAQHLVEMVMEIFGDEIKSVLANKTEDGAEVIFNYNDFSVKGVYTEYEKSDKYSGLVLCEDGEKYSDVTFTDDDFREELGGFVRLLDGGKSPEALDKFIKPVYIMNAIVKSIKTGEGERV
ncbi:MAG: Gfo/Idh/MocA family oxidoreductase [Clostridia bacterium]|nr:Gfo/Idh/MocA family oxidoreductase [Clostridia bacterium]